jgi:hypothetical protein
MFPIRLVRVAIGLRSRCWIRDGGARGGVAEGAEGGFSIEAKKKPFTQYFSFPLS